MMPAFRTKRRALAHALALCTAAFGSPAALAAGAHVHGQGALDVAVEGTMVDLFLRAPLGDVAGEEGSDASALQARFGDAGVFTLAGARCTLAMHEVEVAALADSDAAGEFADESHEHEDHAGHEEHDHGDEHDGHGDHEEHGDHEGHDHDADDHSGHSDALMSWRYECDDQPAALSAAALFERVALEKILVQSIGPGGVTSVTLTPAEPGFTLR